MNPNEWKSCDTCPEREECRGELEEYIDPLGLPGENGGNKNEQD